ncbi:MAG TPA: hypothetical protein VGL77_15915 [Armatimonadota bacterium]
MVDIAAIPSFVGYHPAEAEAAAAALGLTIVWSDATAPHWLSELHTPRVGRQRLRADGVLELLRVLVPTLAETPGDAPA